MRLRILLPALVLTACMGVERPAPASPPAQAPALRELAPDTCGAGGLAALVGGPAGNLRTVVLPGPVRIVGPTSIVTEEYMADRLNVHTDARGTILRIDCG
jgi:hypothetical protein